MLNRDVLWGLTPAAIGSCEYCNKEYTPDVASKLISLSTLVSCPHDQQTEAQLIVSLGIKLVRHRINTLHSKLRSLRAKQDESDLSFEDGSKLAALVSKIHTEEQLLRATLVTLFEKTALEMIIKYDFLSKTLPSFGFKILHAVIENVKLMNGSLSILCLDLMLELTILSKNSSHIALLPVLFDFIQVPFSVKQRSISIFNEIQSKLVAQYAELLPSSQSSIKAFASTLFLISAAEEMFTSSVTVFYPLISIIDSIKLDDFLLILSKGPSELTSREAIRCLTDCMLLTEVMVLSMSFYMKRVVTLNPDPSHVNISDSQAIVPCFVQRYIHMCQQLSSRFTVYVQEAIQGMVENPHIFKYLNTEEQLDLPAGEIHVNEPEDENTQVYNDICAGIFSEHGFISSRDIYHIASWSFVLSSAELFWATSQLTDIKSLSAIKVHKFTKDITTMIRTLAPIFHKEVIGACRAPFQSLISYLAKQPSSHQEAESARIILTAINRTLLSLIGSPQIPISRGAGSLPALVLSYVNGIVSELQQRHPSKDIIAYDFLAQSTLGPDSADNSFITKSPNNNAEKDGKGRKQRTLRGQLLNMLHEDWYLYLNKSVGSILNALLRNMATLRLLRHDSDTRSVIHSMLVLHTMLLEATTPFEFKIFSRIAGELITLLERYGSKNYLFKCAAFSTLMGLASRISRQTSKHQKRYHIEDLFLSRVFRSSTYALKSDPGLFALLQIVASCAPSQTATSFLQSSHPHVLSTIISSLSAPCIHLRISAARALSPIFGTGSNALLRLFTELKSAQSIDINGLHGIILACRVLIRPYTPFREGRGHPLLTSVKVKANAAELASCRSLIESFLYPHSSGLRALANANVCISELNGIISDLQGPLTADTK